MELSFEESIRIVLNLAEESALTEEDVQRDLELDEERERQLQAIANVRYNLDS